MKQIKNARRAAGSNIPQAAVIAIEDAQQRLRDVGDMHKVPLLLAHAIHRDRLPVAKHLGKDGDDAAFEVRPLARPIDVGKARDADERPLNST